MNAAKFAAAKLASSVHSQSEHGNTDIINADCNDCMRLSLEVIEAAGCTPEEFLAAPEASDNSKRIVRHVIAWRDRQDDNKSAWED